MSRLSGCVLAMVVEDGVDRALAESMAASLRGLGAVVHALSSGGHEVRAKDGTRLDVQADARRVRPRYYDGMLLMGGEGTAALEADRALVGLLVGLHDAGRPLAAWGEAAWTLARAGLAHGAEGIVVGAPSGSVDAFVQAFVRDVEAMRRRDEVEEASVESFPASDAPGRGSII